ncbi:TraB/GumN family protein [Sphingomonas sp. CFBP 13720]|uniref:TraB/GumN family protein n=1 Tax=Sphingomonas sp. CFBP 13720 TaxID=2775302 RepID=UPI001784ED28|nr:TraB/GumN family protein [Sphingomonas sp. CFBP 13720]MBD8679161.1 TraB/GumN family protein [Sphingomonas sp. CFBP 13720]
MTSARPVHLLRHGLAAIAAWLLLASPVAAPAVLHPALWAARDADTTIWLFGTVHDLPPGTAWLYPAAAKALAASDTLVLELVAPTPAETAAALADAAPPSDAPPLPARLPAAVAARLPTALAAAGLRPDAFDRADPWLAATALTAARLHAAGYRRDGAPETLLAARARRAGMPVIGLEDQAEQIAMFDSLPHDVQVAMLERTIAGGDRAVAAMAELVAAWGAGDTHALAAIVGRDLPPAMRPALLTDRNDRWAAAIARWMRLPGTRFVAVGAGHLAGPDAVQARLRLRGIATARVRSRVR